MYLVNVEIKATQSGYKAKMSFTDSKDKLHEKLIETAAQVCAKVNPDIRTWTGRVVSGDQFISDKAIKDRIISNFGGFCTEMEGAAIAQAAYLNKIPFVILRAISDKADDSATMDYPAFEKKAIEHSVRLVLGMMEALA